MIPPSLNTMYLAENERNALTTFVDRVQRNFPGNLLSIQVFGSRARGDAGSDSDMDLLVVMAQADLETKRAIRSIAVEIWLIYGIYLSTRVWSEAHRRQHAAIHSSFYRNLQRDAIDVFPPTVEPAR
jgi:predicted nucleotidyltransferase